MAELHSCQLLLDIWSVRPLTRYVNIARASFDSKIIQAFRCQCRNNWIIHILPSNPIAVVVTVGHWYICGGMVRLFWIKMRRAHCLMTSNIQPCRIRHTAMLSARKQGADYGYHGHSIYITLIYWPAYEDRWVVKVGRVHNFMQKINVLPSNVFFHKSRAANTCIK